MEAGHGLAAKRSVAPPPPDSVPAGPASDQQRLRAALSQISGMDADGCVSSLLPGGLTNRNYCVEGPDGRRVFVRLSDERTSQLGIDRPAEHANSLAAAAAGVAPAVLAYLPEQGVLALEWIDAQTLSAAALDDSTMITRVAGLCRELHQGPSFQGTFDMFALQERYLQIVESNGYRRPHDYLEHLPAAATIRAAVTAGAPAAVPCHNDLLPANIMATGEQLWFIDFEYAGVGDPDFELGNLWSEAHLAPERLQELVAGYYGSCPPAKLARARLHALMSDFGWTLWACIQAATSELDFDFYSWGFAKYERALAVLRGSELPDLVSAVNETTPAKQAMQNH